MNAIQVSRKESKMQPEKIVQRAQGLVEEQMHFAGRSHRFEFDLRDDVLVIRGNVPSFYLKQVLQNALKGLEGVRRIDNQVTVVSGEYLDELGNV